MNRKFIDIEGITLSYLDNETDSARIVFFIHGNSGSAWYWHKQYKDEALQQYRLIVFDLPAHGESGPSANPAEDYNLIGLGRIMARAVHTIAPVGCSYILAGLSLGTNIIAEMLAHKSIVPKGIVLVSSCITGDDLSLDKIFKAEFNSSFLFVDEPDRNAVKAGFATILSDAEQQNSGINDYYNVKSPFRSALAVSVAQGKFSNEIALLRGFMGKALIVFGKDEVSVNPDYLDSAVIPVWRNKIKKLSGNHFVNMDSSGELNALLLRYCYEISF